MYQVGAAPVNKTNTVQTNKKLIKICKKIIMSPLINAVSELRLFKINISIRII